MYTSFGEDPSDAREGRASGVRNDAAAVGSRLVNPVVGRLGARPARVSYDDPAHHARPFMRRAVIVIDARHSERDVEVLSRLHEISRIPRHGALGDSQGVLVVTRVISCR